MKKAFECYSVYAGYKRNKKELSEKDKSSIVRIWRLLSGVYCKLVVGHQLLFQTEVVHNTIHKIVRRTSYVDLVLSEYCMSSTYTTEATR